MSWASHNPELYDEMCVRGVVNHLQKLTDRQGFVLSRDALAMVVDALMTDATWRAFALDRAWREIGAVEQEYFGDLTDAVERTDHDTH